MKLCLHGPLLAAGLTVLAAAPVASAIDYTYLEGGYVSIDRGRNDDSGLRIAGSLGLASRVALIGEYADADDYRQLSAGALFHAPMSGQWDLVLGATLEEVDAGRVDDTGFGLRAGARWRQAASRLQLEPELRVIEVFDDTATSLRVGGQFELKPRLDLAGALQGGDDDRFELGVRYRFGA